MEKLLADSAVEPHRLGHMVDIGAGNLAEVGHFVDKSDFCRQERIGRIFDHFRSFKRGDDKRRLDQVKGVVDILHDGDGLFALRADRHTVRSHEVFDGRPFPLEFWVGDDIEGRRHGLMIPDDLFDPTTRPHRDRRFDYHHFVAFHVPRDLLRHLLHC